MTIPEFPLRTQFSINDIHFTEDLVQRALKTLQTVFHLVQTVLHQFLLRKYLVVLLHLYVQMFNVCFYSGILPNQWLEVHVIPVFKRKGSVSNPNNYRPISLTCVVCKVMEQCVM